MMKQAGFVPEGARFVAPAYAGSGGSDESDPYVQPAAGIPVGARFIAAARREHPVGARFIAPVQPEFVGLDESSPYAYRCGQSRPNAMMMACVLVMFALLVCLVIAVPRAFAANPLSMDASDMTIAVGESADRAYELSTPGSFVNIDGKATPMPYEMSVLSSDPTVARGQAADGILSVHGYSGGQTVITLQALDARGGAAGEVSFNVTVEGEDTTLEQAIIVVGDEGKEEALERIDEANGIEHDSSSQQGSVATEETVSESATGVSAGDSNAGQSAASSDRSATSQGDTASGGAASSRDAASSATSVTSNDEQGLSPLAIAAIVAAIVIAVVCLLVLRGKRAAANGTVKCLLAVIVAFGGAAGLLGGPHPTAWAYFDRGPVGISVGQYEVVLEQGQSMTIMCAISPEYDDQLPGCGMAECPQTCGEGCLDSHGQCTCAGLEYTRWYTSVNAFSTNPSVARADYGGGVLMVSGYEPGDATVTVSASLKQFQDNAVSIHVVVNEPPLIPEDDPNSEDISDDPGPSDDSGSGDDPEGDAPDPEDEPGDEKGVDGGEGDADTNVIDGTGDSEDAKLDPGTASDPDASFDKPDAAAPKEAESAPEATPETPDAPEPEPEVPVEPDVAKPVVLYELEEVEPESTVESLVVDPATAGATGAAACAFMMLGVAGTRRQWRHEIED